MICLIAYKMFFFLNDEIFQSIITLYTRGIAFIEGMALL